MTDINKTKTEQYKLLLQQIDGLLNKDEPIITNLANVVAALKQTFSKISWVGFYLAKNNNLFLGPFQGKVACTKIEIGKGVCGTAAKLQESQIVPNVHEFPGHIACDVESNSEIVVPLIYGENIYAVLDLDSTDFSNFDETDKYWLERICSLIEKQLSLSTNNLF